MSLLLALTGGGSPTNYTITANAGSYALTGQSATILRSKLVTANNGTYALTGQSATLLRSKVVTASNGTYLLSGQDATISYGQIHVDVVGGSGWPYLPTGKKTKARRFDDELTIAMREIYEGVEEPEIVRQAAKIVRPFVQKGVQKTSVPKPETIDWKRLEKDAEKVSALLALWQEQLESLEDEEMCILMSTL